MSETQKNASFLAEIAFFHRVHSLIPRFPLGQLNKYNFAPKILSILLLVFLEQFQIVLKVICSLHFAP